MRTAMVVTVTSDWYKNVLEGISVDHEIDTGQMDGFLVIEKS